jgi:hypothetical protein
VFRRNSFSDQSFKDDSFEFGDDPSGTAQGQTTSATGTVSGGITGTADTGQGQGVEATGTGGRVHAGGGGAPIIIVHPKPKPPAITGTAESGQGGRTSGFGIVVNPVPVDEELEQFALLLAEL